jgi:hypothetical protein
MNLQCPSCLKPLTVPDQYAGQMMKCPLCASTFSVPAQAGDHDPIPQLPALPQQNTPNLPTPTPTMSSPTNSSTPTPTPSSPTVYPEGEEEPDTPAPTRTPSRSAKGTPDGYTQSFVWSFNVKIMRWFAPVALLVIFFLQFFPWVGLYPGGFPTVTQGAWGAAFGSYSEDDDLIPKTGVPEDRRPTASAMMIFYVLLFLPTLLITVAALLLDLGVIDQKAIPPAVQALLKWRWHAVAGLNVLVFMFLFLQLIFGFSIESKVYAEAAKTAGIAAAKDTKAKKEAQIEYGTLTSIVARTFYLTLAFWLHVLAVIGSVTTSCLHERGGKPDPKLELVW